MKTVTFAFSLLLLPALAQAQTLDRYQLKIYLVGGATPISAPTDLLVSSFTCNQNPPGASTSTANPTRVVFDDPGNPGKVCIYVDPATGPLLSLPFNSASYEGTLAPGNSAGVGQESNRAPFSHPGNPPGVQLTGVRFIK